MAYHLYTLLTHVPSPLNNPTTPPPLTPHEALSGIFGSISLASWIFVLLPQLYENYTSSSAAGISATFLVIWLVGDVANLVGSIWAELVPTVVALAVYFCFADLVLIAQVGWYEYWPGKRSKGEMSTNGGGERDADEEEPLLGRRTSNGSVGLPGSQKRRRRSSAVSQSRASATGEQDAANLNGSIGVNGRRESTLDKIPEDVDAAVTSSRREWIKNTLGIIAILVIGTAGWAIAYRAGLWIPAAAPGDEGGHTGHGKGKKTPVGAEILGYASAVLYLGARIPQIVKNWREQSCEGLSLLFFLLSLLGNLTYGAGILCHALDREYVIKNVPWLIGSLGTMVEDITIFVQFKLYRDGERRQSDEDAAE